MSNAIIKTLFETRVKVWAEGKSYPVRFHNQEFDPAQVGEEGFYLEFYVLPAPTTSATEDGKHRAYNGVLQFNLCQMRGVGSNKTLTVIAEIEALFPNAQILTDVSGFKVQQITPMSASPPIEGDHFKTPVSARYQAHTFVS